MVGRRAVLVSLVAMLAGPIWGAEDAEMDFTFNSIDGAEIRLSDFIGKPVLVVNTASLCGFTYQYEQLQALHEAYDGKAVVLAIPSEDFGGQEYASEAEVKEFCSVNFGLTLPMTEITRVLGTDRHPFYDWAATQGIEPRWNFHKILIGPDGEIVREFPTPVRPDSPEITEAIESLIAQGYPGPA
ncbi:glutathione peroxidase [Algicella marina]